VKCEHQSLFEFDPRNIVLTDLLLDIVILAGH